MTSSLSSFSKVGDILEEDEEEERLRVSTAARARFKAAQDAYTSKGSKEEVLRSFEEAETCMAPLLDNGLMSLGARELEAVLKGRLHQAVILAQLEHIPNRWSRVKALTEDVLQFDFGNCHGRWLRALALQNVSKGGRSAEAEDEMRRAIEYARSQGKTTEAAQWEAELQRFMGGSDDAASGVTPEAVSEDVTTDPVPSKPAAGKQPVVSQDQSRDKSGRSPSLQKGFFNKRSPKTSNAAAASSAAAASTPAATSSASMDQASSDTAVASASSHQASLKEETHELLREQRCQLEEQRVQLDALRRQLHEEQQQVQAQRGESLRLQEIFKERLGTIGAEFEQALADEAAAAESSNASASVRAARERREAGALKRASAAAAEAQEFQKSARTWSEAQHQRYLDLSTELLTLQAMSEREHRDRQDASKQQVAEMRDIAKRMGDLKAATKTLRDHVRLKTAGAPRGEKEELEVQRMAESAADFRALSFSAKLAAFADDGAVLKLSALAVLMGMLLMLGIFVEAFGRYQCRFVCSG